MDIFCSKEPEFISSDVFICRVQLKTSLDIHVCQSENQKICKRGLTIKFLYFFAQKQKETKCFHKSF